MQQTPRAERQRPRQAESGQQRVQRADWRESIHGTSTGASTEAAGGSAVVQVSAEAEASDATQPTIAHTNRDSESRTDSGTPQLLPELRPEQRISRLDWPDSAGHVNPEETLRDWAENAGLLLGFGMVSLWLVRQWMGKRTLDGGPTTHLRTIESLSLPQRCRLHLVDVQGRQVVVAADAAGVKSVTVLPERFPELIDESEVAADATSAAQPAGRPEDLEHGDRWNTLRESQLA